MFQSKPCPHCDQPVRAGARFCPACGYEISGDVPGSLSRNEAQLALDRQRLDFGRMAMAHSARQQFEVSNAGKNRLAITVQSVAPWLSAIPGPYYLGPGQSQMISVQADTTNLAHLGRHSGQIIFRYQGGEVSLPATVEIEPPFILNPADAHSGVSSLEEVRRYCDANWRAAVQLLADGRLETCLAFLGEARWLPSLQSARALPDPNIGLETFLHNFDAKRGRRPALHNGRAVEARLGLGPYASVVRKPPGKVALVLRNPNKHGYLWGAVQPKVDWLRASPGAFGCGPGERASLELAVDAAHWPRRGRAWSWGLELYEIALGDLNGRPARRFVHRSAPGTYFWVGIALAGLLLMAAGLGLAVASVLPF